MEEPVINQGFLGINWDSQIEHKMLGLRAGTEPCKLELNCLYFTWQGYRKQSYQGR